MMLRALPWSLIYTAQLVIASLTCNFLPSWQWQNQLPSIVMAVETASSIWEVAQLHAVELH